MYRISLASLLCVCLYLAKCFLHDESKTMESMEKLYPYEEYFLMKQYPEKNFHVCAYDNSLKEVQYFSGVSGNRSTGQWRDQGPGNIGARSNCIAVDPKNEKIIFIGYSEGGLFRTYDGGINWQPVFDDQLKLSIGSIAIDPVHSNIIYVGTGDPNVSGYPFIGDGIYKSIDGGDTWNYTGLLETRIISQIVVSKVNSNIIYASAMGIPFEKNEHRGVYKSTNGGMNWKQVLFINDSTGISSLVLHPSNPEIVYAAGWNRIRNNKRSLVSGPDGKIFRSTNGGQTWQTLSGGLPQDESSRIGLAISESNPNVLYACYATAGDYNLRGIYKTTDGGTSWVQIPTDASSGMDGGIYGGFGWYFGKIAINPTDENDIFLLGIDLYRSVNSGQNWTIAAPPWWQYEVHSDKHDLIFENNTMFLATDGGVYASEIDKEKWNDIENIATSQFYRVAYNPNHPDIYFGGAQDNGTSSGNENKINEWTRIYGGDGFQPVFHPQNEALFYVETQNGGISVSQDGGANFADAISGIESSDPRNWDMPFLMSRHNSDVLYTGTNRIYTNTAAPSGQWTAISEILTNNSAEFFRHNISAIHESPVNSNHLAAGTSDGEVWISNDKGVTWENVSQQLPDKYVSSICYSSENEDYIYVSFTGYKDNDFTPYIYQSSNHGKTWKPIQSNMPHIAINNILVLPQDDGIIDANIFVATDGGVFYTSNHGLTWERLGNNMPIIAVYDIDFNPVKNQIIAGTFGRSIQSFDLSQINYPLVVQTQEQEYSSKGFYLKNNISADHIVLMLNNTERSTPFSIIDVNAKEVFKGFLTGELNEIDISNLCTGVYYITVYGENRKSAKPFFKL